MENLVNFRADQHITSDDLNNIELYAQQTFIDLVNGAIDPGQKYAGLNVTANGLTSINIAAGQYFGNGQIYTIPNSTIISLTTGLPVALSKMATLCIWGIQQQQNVQPRAYIINADTGQFQPQTVAMETSYVVQMQIVYGQESAVPTRGPIPSGVIAVCDIQLSPSGITSMTMSSITALGSVAQNAADITALEAWQQSVEMSINTLTTDIAIITQSIPPNLAASLTALTQLVQQIWNLVNKPATAVYTAVEKFINTNNSQTGLSGYSAIVSDGLRFPAGSQLYSALTLLNPFDQSVMTIGNMTLPAFQPVVRHQFLPAPIPSITIQIQVATYVTVWELWIGWWSWGYSPHAVLEFIWESETIPPNIISTLYMSSFPSVSLPWRQRMHRRTAIRYGDFVTSAISVQPNGTILNAICASNSVANQSSAAGIAEVNARPALTYFTAQRSGGELYTVDWPTFWKADNPTELISNRDNGCWFDYYDNPYWDAIYQSGTNAGIVLGHVFLNESNGWLCGIQFWPSGVPSSGDMQLYICEVDGSYAPDMTKVMMQMTVPNGAITIGAQGTYVPIIPVFLAGGTSYAVVMQSGANFSFVSAAAAQQAGSVYQEAVLWYLSAGGQWVAPPGASQTPIYFCTYMAEFLNTYSVTQMNPGQLAAGISSLRLMHAGYAPPGTSITWQAQIGGVWQDLDANNPGQLESLPTLLPLQVVMTGTMDCMPAIDLTQNELELSQIATSMTYFEDTVALGSATTSIKIMAFVTGWDGSHHTLGAKVHSGGTTYTPGTTVITPDPTNPTSVQITWTFTVTSTSSFYWEIDGTTVSGYGYPLATQVWAYTY